MIAAVSGTATTSARRQVTRRRGGAACAAARRTRSRSSAGAMGRAARSVRARSSCDIEGLLQLLQRAAELRRAVRRRDTEHVRRGCGVELEHDPQRDHLALTGGERAQRSLELWREAVAERLVVALRQRGELLAPHAPPL